jgi:hypothetical protein
MPNRRAVSSAFSRPKNFRLGPFLFSGGAFWGRLPGLAGRDEKNAPDFIEPYRSTNPGALFSPLIRSLHADP